MAEPPSALQMGLLHGLGIVGEEWRIASIEPNGVVELANGQGRSVTTTERDLDVLGSLGLIQRVTERIGGPLVTSSQGWAQGGGAIKDIVVLTEPGRVFADRQGELAPEDGRTLPRVIEVPVLGTIVGDDDPVPRVAAMVIGEDVDPQWYGALPPGVPSIVRTAAARARAVDELRSVADHLREAVPAAVGVEREIINLTAAHLDTVIDLLALRLPDMDANAAEAPAIFWQAVTLLRIVTRVLEGFTAWERVVELAREGLKALGVE